MLSLLTVLLVANPVGADCPAQPDAGFFGTVQLGMGTQKVLTVPFVGEPRFTSPGVAEFKRLEGNQLLIIGVDEGRGQLVLERPDGGVLTYGVHVRKLEVCGMVPVELRALFPCDSTLDVRMVGDHLFLDGVASSLDEWRAAQEALRRYPSLILLGRLDPAVVDATVRAANEALRRAGFARLKFSLYGDKALLEGEFPEGEGARVEALRAHWLHELEVATWKPPLHRDGGTR